ncbi:MAG: hypothetical protein OXT71_08985 [Acidobacteriota bacterium]|nr:hypothetical protein [Acidobacteriota bacterium]
MTPVTGKIGRVSAPGIHDQRLEALTKPAVERLRIRRAFRCPDCGESTKGRRVIRFPFLVSDRSSRKSPLPTPD